MSENNDYVVTELEKFVEGKYNTLKAIGMLDKNKVESAYENASAYIELFQRKFSAFGNKKLPIELWCDICNEDEAPRYCYSLELSKVNPENIKDRLPDLINAENPKKWKGDKWDGTDLFDINPEHYRQLILETASVPIDDFDEYDQSTILDEKKVKAALKRLKGNEDYLLFLSYYFDESEFDKATKEFFDEIIPCLQKNDLKDTEKLTEVLSRRGQDVYRKMLMDYWDEKCAVTGCGEENALRASHAKPWKTCKTAKERINKYNGFLLSANLDALFDKGLITFSDDGEIQISKKIKEEDAIALGVIPNLHLRKIEEEHRKFLQYHREHVWKG